MVKKQKKRTNHIPQRTCVGCRQVLPKKELMRIIRTSNGIKFDPTGKADGRGAYVHNKRSCWEYALKGSLEKTLKTEMTEKDRNHLLQLIDTIPQEENDGQQ